METVLAVLSNKVSSAFEQCGISGECGTVSVSDRPDLCQFQCTGAFTAAKQVKKPPKLIADQVVRVLSQDGMFSQTVSAGGGFVNLTLEDSFLLDYVGKLAADANVGIPQAETPETILLDYGGPNMAKPLHIGHLRSAVIGEALKRLVRATGRTAISDVHLGDWGLQMGLVIAELRERHPEWACFSDGFNPGFHQTPVLTAAELNELYPTASKKSREDADFKQEAQQITALLQKGHPGYTALWREIRRVSVADIKRNYDRLGVSFDYWYGESDAEKYVSKLMEILSDRNLLIQSDGALVVDVSEPDDTYEVRPVIIKKSDDANIYATTDLAAIIQRTEEFCPDRIWYIVDSRQSLHFKQVFRCAGKAGLVPDTKLEHLGFGTMNGADGKPYKTRDGGVMPLSELYSSVFEAALERVSASGYGNQADKTETAEKIAAAAIKFGDLVNHRLKDYVFDPGKFLAAEGKTGAFLLYTVARINSILRRYNGEASAPGSLRCASDTERMLLMKLAMSGQAFVAAFTERAPNYICESAWQLASAFSRFYHDCPVLNEEDSEKRSFRVFLCMATKTVLLKHLDVLGIETVEFM